MLLWHITHVKVCVCVCVCVYVCVCVCVRVWAVALVDSVHSFRTHNTVCCFICETMCVTHTVKFVLDKYVCVCVSERKTHWLKHMLDSDINPSITTWDILRNIGFHRKVLRIDHATLFQQCEFLFGEHSVAHGNLTVERDLWNGLLWPQDSWNLPLPVSLCSIVDLYGPYLYCLKPMLYCLSPPVKHIYSDIYCALWSCMYALSLAAYSYYIYVKVV